VSTVFARVPLRTRQLQLHPRPGEWDHYPDDHALTRGYDAAGRLSSVTDLNSHTTSFGYNGDGDLTTTTYGNGVLATDTFATADQLTNTADTKTGTTTVKSPLAAVS
jgi:YD repeat-containing protein